MIIDDNLREIDQLIADGEEVSAGMLSRAYYHKGVFIWVEVMLIFTLIGLITDVVYKRRNKHKRLKTMINLNERE